MKIVINTCYWGFWLSYKAWDAINKLWEKYKRKYDCEYWIKRNNKNLVKVVQEMWKESWGEFAELKVVTIPSGIKWQIWEYDGVEWIAERHKTWD